MLGAMDIPAAAATSVVPWLVLGVVLGMVLMLGIGLAAALALRRAAAAAHAEPPAAPPPPVGPGYREDDLPGFLESPPGSSGGPDEPEVGWAPLGAVTRPEPVAPPEPVAAPEPRRRRDTVTVLGVMTLGSLLLVGAAAAVAATSRSPETTSRTAVEPDPTPPPLGRDGVAARLTFDGVILEQRAVGVTATYPVLEVTANGDGAVAHVEFPTFNCLADQAPADPVAAGCFRSVTEYSDLTSPGLVVTRDGEGLRISGRFPTYLRPNGTPPVSTGRGYELLVTVAPADGRPSGGWQPADGVLHLGPDQAETTRDPGISVLRSGS
jgi:hypothetical protein